MGDNAFIYTLIFYLYTYKKRREWGKSRIQIVKAPVPQ